jgi:hypothetical protein
MSYGEYRDPGAELKRFQLRLGVAAHLPGVEEVDRCLEAFVHGYRGATRAPTTSPQIVINIGQ